MENKEYKYDVAFSFLKEDENLAQELNDLLKDKTITFLYSKRQAKIAGTDGEETFNKVFGQESRVVVVLYRKGWGNSSWTRIEETAIKNRALVEGYEFTLFIPLDEPPSVPNYLPKTYIWFGIHKYGIKVALSIIESKIQSEGGKIKVETPEDIAKRIKEEEQFNNKRNAFLNSESGVEAARLEVKKLYELLKSKKESIEKDINGFSIGFEEKNQNCFVHSYGYSLRFYWEYSSKDSLMDSNLYIALQSPKRYDSPTIINEYRFNFDIVSPDKKVWIFETDRKKYFTSEELVNFSFDILLKRIEKENKTKRLKKYL
ncbi:MAG: hypothetical protein IIC76_11575 [Bacteroidetes bacterium]|nr:hypothetical protein [Bacteroidota bacterium]